MNIKESILTELTHQLDKKIQVLHDVINTAKESRDNETKSSVGDKYETGRAMVQMEIDKNQVQLSNLQNQKNELLKIDLKKGFNKAEFGSLLITNYGNYFISIGHGKIETEGQTWFCISASSPIGKQVLNREAGDQIIFQEKEIIINKIL